MIVRTKSRHQQRISLLIVLASKVTAFVCAVLLLSSCSSGNDDEEQGVTAVYYGTFLSTSSTNSTTSDEYFIDVDIPYEVETIKDTLKYEGFTGTTTHYAFTLTMKEQSSTLDVVEKFDGDSLLFWYTKEKLTYKAGTYKSKNEAYVFEVTADAIYWNYAGAGEERKQLYKALNDYSEIRYSKTSKSEKRGAEDVSICLTCNDNSLHYASGNREYRATIIGNTCLLHEISPEKNDIELDKIK